MLYQKPAYVCADAHSNTLAAQDRGDRKSIGGGGYLLVKFVVEWLVALVLAVAAFPLLVALAALAKLTSPGPALYRQTRLGRHGKPFAIYKIRTMTQNSEVATGPVWAQKEDARVTKIGQFLRETHLDELPQLWNVLTGEMSLIGPRPERPEIVARIERQVPHYRERLAVRPGLTGLAQVLLPADSDIEDVRKKLAHDLHYVEHVNFWMDLRIGISTVLHIGGLCQNALGRLLVKSYGRQIEPETQGQSMPDVAGAQVKTA